MSTWPGKTCGECGTPLTKNRFDDNDCSKCNIENFLFMRPVSKKKEAGEEIEEKIPVPQELERIETTVE